MSKATLWNVSVETSAEAEEAVIELMERLFGQIPSCWSNAETKISTVNVFPSMPPGRRPASGEVQEGLKLIGECGLSIDPGKITIRRVPREDWSHSWKKFFKTIEVGSSLIIKPSWSKRKARAGQAVVVLDPGLSFGTGQHPTTLFCLRQVAKNRPRQSQSKGFLDIGTGSGILAIAAAKLGYNPVEAFDFDPASVRIAQANARKNRLSDRMISIGRKDITRVPAASRQTYDLICANLIDDLLIQQADRILNRLSAGGKLALAGILSRQFAGVQKTYERLGMKLAETKIEGEWQSGLFVRS